jgi:hypothetical protein
MAIAMRILIRIFSPATEVTPGPLLSVQYTYIKRPPNSRCAICSGFEDTTKMRAHSRGTCQADLAADLVTVTVRLSIIITVTARLSSEVTCYLRKLKLDFPFVPLRLRQLTANLSTPKWPAT